MWIADERRDDNDGDRLARSIFLYCYYYSFLVSLTCVAKKKKRRVRVRKKKIWWRLMFLFFFFYRLFFFLFCFSFSRRDSFRLPTVVAFSSHFFFLLFPYSLDASQLAKQKRTLPASKVGDRDARKKKSRGHWHKRVGPQLCGAVQR